MDVHGSPNIRFVHIGDALMEKNISFAYFGEHLRRYQMDPGLTDPYEQNNNICNPFQYAADIMTHPALRAAHIQDTDQLYEDIQKGTLPAVSIVKPSTFSTTAIRPHRNSTIFEGFTREDCPRRCRPIPTCGRTPRSS